VPSLKFQGGALKGSVIGNERIDKPLSIES